MPSAATSSASSHPAGSPLLPEPVPAPPIRRIPIETTGYYYAEAGPKAVPPAPVLVGLHGYAQTAPDFLRLIQKLAPPQFVAASAQGFHQIWDYQNKTIAFSWMTAFEKPDNIRRNNQFMRSMTDTMIAEKLIQPAGIFLLGFSQGSSVAFRFAQRHPERVRGVISVCSDLPPDVEADLAPLKNIPVLVAYGLRDPLVPQEKPIHAADALRQAGIPVEIVSYDRGHVVPSSLAPKIQEWMDRALRTG